nr:winged helix-turn-helix domain-containing protein [Trabulsiella guamensis]
MTFQLTKSSSLCLSILLLNAPDIVLHSTFMREVWHDEEMSTNILYQNISHLRKGLSTIAGFECGTTMIRTISRKGFCFTSEFCQIQLLEDKTEESSISSPLMEKTDECIGSPPQDNGQLTIADTQTTLHERFLQSKIVSFVLIVSAVIIIYLDHLNSNGYYQSFYENYEPFIKEGDCNIYINKDTFVAKTEAIKKGIAAINCKIYPYIYTTSWQHITSVRMVACPKPLDKESSPFCITYVYRG